MAKNEEKFNLTRKRAHGAVLLTVGILIGSIGGIGGAIAATKLSDSTITACANKKTGVLRYAKNGKCRKSERKLQWNQQGPVGATGAQGAAGPAGATGVPGSDAVVAPLTCATGGDCEIGDVGPGGGTVFYVAPTRQLWGKYLEAAPSGWYDGNSSDPDIGWCSASNNYVNDVISTQVPGDATGTAIGEGWMNSVYIARHCPFGAATSARMYRGGGKVDWYLPSKDELQQLYLQRNVVTGLGETNRWSSTESSLDATKAWRRYFNADGGDEGTKQFDNAVRPIRSF